MRRLVELSLGMVCYIARCVCGGWYVHRPDECVFPPDPVLCPFLLSATREPSPISIQSFASFLPPSLPPSLLLHPHPHPQPQTPPSPSPPTHPPLPTTPHPTLSLSPPTSPHPTHPPTAPNTPLSSLLGTLTHTSLPSIFKISIGMLEPWSPR